jgi:hypothetical protein
MSDLLRGVSPLACLTLWIVIFAFPRQMSTDVFGVCFLFALVFTAITVSMMKS